MHFDAGINHIPNRVTIPRFDCVNNPSRYRTHAVGKQVSGLSLRVMPETRLKDLSICEHNLQARHSLEAIAIRRMTEAPFQNIAHETGIRTGARAIHP